MPVRERGRRRLIIFTGRASGCLPICARACARALRRCRTSIVRRPFRSVSKKEIRQAAGVLVPGGDTWAADGRAQMPTAVSRGLALPLRKMMEEGGIYIGICGAPSSARACVDSG